ncbi:hypothetical protein EP227_01105 [bacterium]|nr:MAG: hypothetical protein EP227_01105 [bacterium]
MKKNIIFIAILIIVVTLLYLFSTEEIVPIPYDREHAGVSEEGCMDCHGVDRENPLSKEHPPKYQCMKCHALQKPGRK